MDTVHYSNIVHSLNNKAHARWQSTVAELLLPTGLKVRK